MLNSFQSPGDIAFTLFNLPVYYYGIIMAFAIFCGFITAYFLYKNFYDDKDVKNIIDFAPLLIILGVIGARAYYCLVNLSYYKNHLLEIFNIRQGGLSVHGMIFVGILSLYCFAKYYNMSFRKLLDVFLCGSILAQSIGRWGNFFNSEAFGFPCDLPWKLYIPISHRPVGYLGYEYFHPTFLYESILDFFVFIILFVFFKKLSKKPGTIAGLYLILYSFVRIFVESFRIDSVLNIGSIPIAQIISVVLFVAGVAFLIVLKKEA